jgi:hypothetical protein
MGFNVGYTSFLQLYTILHMYNVLLLSTFQANTNGVHGAYDLRVES